LLVAGVEAGYRIDDARLRAAPSLRGSAVLRQVSVRATAGEASSVLVGHCADVAPLLHLSARECRRGVTLDGQGIPTGARLQAVEMVVGADGLVQTTPVGPEFAAPRRPVRSAYLSALSQANGLAAASFVPLETLPSALAAGADRFQGTVVAQPERDRLEAARTTLVRAAGGSSALTTGESLAIATKDTRTFRGLTLAAFLSGALVAGLSLFVATGDHIREQRRVWQTLWVVGCPSRLVRRALWYQVVVTTVPVLLISFGLSIVAGRAFLDLADSPPALPWLELFATFAGSLIAPLLTTLVVRRWLRPDLSPRLSSES
jgi:hypothetical protein